MVTAVAPDRVAPPAPSLVSPERASVARRPVQRARLIPVAAYPAGVPRWVTYDGRRQRVVAVHQQPVIEPRAAGIPPGAQRMQIELAGGDRLTLLHDRFGWYGDDQGM